MGCLLTLVLLRTRDGSIGVVSSWVEVPRLWMLFLKEQIPLVLSTRLVAMAVLHVGRGVFGLATTSVLACSTRKDT